MPSQTVHCLKEEASLKENSRVLPFSRPSRERVSFILVPAWQEELLSKEQICCSLATD